MRFLLIAFSTDVAFVKFRADVALATNVKLLVVFVILLVALVTNV